MSAHAARNGSVHGCSNLSNANLNDSCVWEANLSGADVTGAIVTNMTFYRTTCPTGYFTSSMAPATGMGSK